MNIPEIKFGKCLYDERVKDGVFVKSYSETTAEDFDRYTSEVKDSGYTLNNTQIIADNTFHTLVDGKDAVYLAYYPTIGEMRAVYEENSAYLDFEYGNFEKITTTTITQVDLTDFGLSYVVRLCDGKFIVFDGGLEKQEEADTLINVLREQCVTETIVIAGWIMTHPHIDHYRCFMPFMASYGDEVTVERMLFNFPGTDEETQAKVKEFNNYSDECKNVDRFLKLVDELKIPVIIPHTGQVYDFADSHFEILSSLDDTFFIPAPELNPLSLMMKMTCEEQDILWTGDGYFDWSKMAERWGGYLKSDIVQLPHHGFCGGREAEYDLIDAKVCLAPTFEVDAFETIDIYFDFNRHLIYKTNLQEFISGGPDVYGTTTLTLPYTPEDGAREKLLARVDAHQHKVGETAWHFDNVTLSKAVLEFYNNTIFDSNMEITVTYEDGSTQSCQATSVRRQTIEVDLSKYAISNDETASIDIKSDLPVMAKIK